MQVLVMDPLSVRILSSCLKMKDVIDERIACKEVIIHILVILYGT